MEFVLAFCITIYSCVHNQLKDSYLKYIDAYKGEYLDTTTHTTHTQDRHTHSNTQISLRQLKGAEVMKVIIMIMIYNNKLELRYINLNLNYFQQNQKQKKKTKYITMTTLKPLKSKFKEKKNLLKLN